MDPALTLLKIGGKLLDDQGRLLPLLHHFAQLSGYKILVHGGGALATRVSRQMGWIPKIIDGRRITTQQDIQVVTMVYAGWMNKYVVAQLQHYNCNALGLSGADGNIILSKKRPVKEFDYGFVGDVIKINVPFLHLLLSRKIVPVFSAITHDGNGNLLNTNADTVAAELAKALTSHFNVRLIYCFDKKGVLEDVTKPDSIIRILDYRTYKKGVEEGTFQQGMLPKLQNGFDALEQKVSQVIIGDESIFEKNNNMFTRLILK